MVLVPWSQRWTAAPEVDEREQVISAAATILRSHRHSIRIDLPATEPDAPAPLNVWILNRRRAGPQVIERGARPSSRELRRLA